MIGFNINAHKLILYSILVQKYPSRNKNPTPSKIQLELTEKVVKTVKP